MKYLVEYPMEYLMEPHEMSDGIQWSILYESWEYLMKSYGTSFGILWKMLWNILECPMECPMEYPMESSMISYVISCLMAAFKKMYMGLWFRV